MELLVSLHFWALVLVGDAHPHVLAEQFSSKHRIERRAAIIETRSVCHDPNHDISNGCDGT